jgi:2-hydroxy-6-oxonona-2,4-dienedioate hydrolase
LWVDLLGAEVKFYDAAGIRTRSIEAGQGPALIFLHGSGGHAEAFALNVIPLSDQFRVCSVDMIGHGMTDKPESGYQATDFVNHIVAFMDAAGIDRAHIAGESLGGWVAMWTALLHPERVRRIVSICGAGLTIQTDEASREHARAGSAELRRLGQQFVQNPTRENLQARMNWLFHDPADVTDEIMDVRSAIYDRPGAQAALTRVGAAGGLGNADYGLNEEKLAKFPAPLLYLWTEFNPTTTAATASRAQKATPGSQFLELKDCAHWPQWEETEPFNRAIREFCGAA